MASLIGTLYPPVIDTFMPAFIYTKAVRVYYSLPAYGNLNNINWLHITVTDQKTNQNALRNKAGLYTIQNPLQQKYFDTEKQQYFVEIPSDNIEGKFKPDQFYKVQLRFDCTPEGATPDGIDAKAIDINSYVMDIDNQAYFSEWSTVCLIRPIYKPKIELVNFSNDTDSATSVILGILPISGRLVFQDGDNIADTNEQLYSYQISITDTNNNILLSTDVIYTSDEFNNNNINTVLNLMNANIDIDDSQLDTQTFYLNVKYTTNNLYEGFERFSFSIDSYYTEKEKTDPGYYYTKDENIYHCAVDNENGYVKLLSGFDGTETTTSQEEDKDNVFFYLMRSTSEGNFKDWQILYSDYFSNFKKLKIEDKEAISTLLYGEQDSDMKAWSYKTKIVNKEEKDEEGNVVKDEDGNVITTQIQVLDVDEGQQLDPPKHSNPFDPKVVYQVIDDTVQSMTWYKYCIQFYIPGNGLTPPRYYTTIDNSNTVCPQFYDILLNRAGVQVPLRFNPNITSYKKNVARTKIDTLGGRYPKFAENAMMNYRQYSITGTISANMDDMKTFMKRSDYFTDAEVQNLYKEFLIKKNIPSILKDKEEEDKASVISSFDIDTIGYEYYEWLWERVFREKLYDWLNDGEPKLMRSLPEGNVLVMLTDISLTPNRQVGRLISDFTCTAYEVGEGVNSLKQLREAGVLAYPANIYTTMGEGSSDSSGGTSVFSTYGVPVQMVFQDYLDAQVLKTGSTTESDSNLYYNIYLNNHQYSINGHETTDASKINFVDLIKKMIILNNGYGLTGLNKNKILDNFYLSDIKIIFGEENKDNLSTFYLKEDGSWGTERQEGKVASKGHLMILNNQTRIFTNQNTYEIPSDFNVNSLTFEEDSYEKISNIQIDCLAHFSTTIPGQSNLVSRVVENINAQYNRVFHSYEWLDRKIKAEKDFIDAGTKTKTYLRNWTGKYIETSKPAVYIIKDIKGITQKDKFLLSDRNGYYDMSALGNFQDIAYVGSWSKDFVFEENLFDSTKDRMKPMSDLVIETKVQKWWVPATVQTFGVARATDENEPLDNIVDTYYNENQYNLNNSEENNNFYWQNGNEGLNG